jgi:hypothetical protein
MKQTVVPNEILGERERERGGEGLIESDHTILPTFSFSLQVFRLGPLSAS